MYQGETVSTTIKGLPFLVFDIQEMDVVFRTITKILVVKKFEDCTYDVDKQEITCVLSEQDTINFPVGPIQRNVVFVLKNGKRYEYRCCDLMCYETGMAGRTYVPPADDADHLVMI